MVSKKSIAYMARAAIISIPTLIGVAGGIIASSVHEYLQERYNPPPIVRKIEQLKNDREVQLYENRYFYIPHNLDKLIREEEATAISKLQSQYRTLQSIVVDPEVREYVQLKKKLDESKKSLGDFTRKYYSYWVIGTSTGLLAGISLLLYILKLAYQTKSNGSKT